MLIESVSIFAILLCIIVIFLRSGHQAAALGSTPLLILPAAHVAAVGISLGVAKIMAFPREAMVAFADIGAVLVSGILIHLFAQKLPKGKVRQLYILLVSGYNIILACTFVYRTLMPLFE